jgi:hypothetical protein
MEGIIQSIKIYDLLLKYIFVQTALSWVNIFIILIISNALYNNNIINHKTMVTRRYG